uniref:DUF4116 domain-containing protein n=2 Tax=Chaetoceros debilis TaxID=122233 RepID=A0A7S3Q607_9STRA
MDQSHWSDEKKEIIRKLSIGEKILYDLPKKLKADKDVVMAAVTQDGGALEYATEKLKGDREVVLAAVTQNGRALKYAAEELKGDREFMLAAVTQDVRALEYAAEELKGDREFVLAAMNLNGWDHQSDWKDEKKEIIRKLSIGEN